ncbi:hypothetical protein L6261_04325 [Candidatus Parcubacteria bacterium]|nr:hypothetical protein [Candidatus Parcubacteria bacterium]
MKKILFYSLIIIVLITGIFGPVGVQSVHAADAPNILDGVYCFQDWKLSLTGCTAIASKSFYSLTANILTVSGSFFDALLMFSLNKETIDQPFVGEAWGNVRGFANMLFILVLVAISISIILDLGAFNQKTLIRDVIIIALLVNFSLFAARIVIDAGSIVSLGFYDAIDAPVRKDPLLAKPLLESTGLVEKNISGAIMSTFNPARLIDAKSFAAWKDSYIDEDKGQDSANMALALIFIVAIGLNLYTAWLFFQAGWIFIVRVTYLWIIMALAPLAFLSYVIPQLKIYWNRWWKELFNKSFCIVVFLFLLWLTLQITGSSFFKGAFAVAEGQEPNFLRLITLVIMQALTVYTLLGKTIKETKKMCDSGVLGEKVTSWAKTGLSLATGAVVGAATGGVGLAASQTIGGWASRAAKATTESGGGTTRLGKMRLQALRKIEGTSFAPKSALFGKEGYKQRTERVSKEHTEYMKTLPTEIKQTKKFGLTGAKGIEYGDNLVGKNAQEIYRQKIKNVSPISFMVGERAGENKFVLGYDKAEKKSLELRTKQAELQKFKDERSKIKKKNEDADTTTQTKQIEELEDEIKDIREDIKKTGVGIIKEKKMRPNEKEAVERLKKIKKEINEKS